MFGPSRGESSFSVGSDQCRVELVGHDVLIVADPYGGGGWVVLVHEVEEFLQIMEAETVGGRRVGRRWNRLVFHVGIAFGMGWR